MDVFQQHLQPWLGLCVSNCQFLPCITSDRHKLTTLQISGPYFQPNGDALENSEEDQGGSRCL